MKKENEHKFRLTNYGILIIFLMSVRVGCYILLAAFVFELLTAMYVAARATRLCNLAIFLVATWSIFKEDLFTLTFEPREEKNQLD
ncbi:MAG: hypothetical protein PHF79_01215 [Candidatus Pacebacteria bacterium]|nr:hypothetical protein [Candidatus Paceibacterota bacterium]